MLWMLSFTYIQCLKNTKTKHSKSQFQPINNHIGLHDVLGMSTPMHASDADLHVNLYLTHLRLGKKTFQLTDMTYSTSAILVCIMHLGMTNTMHSLDADFYPYLYL